MNDPLKLHNDCQTAGGGPHNLPPAEPVSDPKLAEAVERVGHLADWFGWRSGHTPTKGDDRGRRRVWLDLRTVIESLERLKAEARREEAEEWTEELLTALNRELDGGDLNANVREILSRRGAKR